MCIFAAASLLSSSSALENTVLSEQRCSIITQGADSGLEERRSALATAPEIQYLVT